MGPLSCAADYSSDVRYTLAQSSTSQVEISTTAKTVTGHKNPQLHETCHTKISSVAERSTGGKKWNKVILSTFWAHAYLNK
jgi:hypothetical protein